MITLALILGIRAADPGFVESVRLRYFDTLITSQPAVQNNIHVIDIDDATLEKYGQWPLPRDQYARIIQELYNRNAGLVVFNVLMPNPDRSGKDAVLLATLKQYPVVLPSVPSDRTQNQPSVPGSAVIGAEWSDGIVQYPGMIANIPVLENAAAGVGIVGTMPEIDGVNRRVPLVVAVDVKI